jgi:hypothetical protein
VWGKKVSAGAGGWVAQPAPAASVPASTADGADMLAFMSAGGKKKKK